MKIVICLHRILSNIFEITVRMLAVGQLSFKSLSPFSKASVIFAVFKIDGKSPLSAQLLKKSQI